MTAGIRVVKPGNFLNTPDQTQVVIDTTQGGSMKIYRILRVRLDLENMTSTFLNGSGYTMGRITYPHLLGYPPATSSFNYLYDSTNFASQLPIVGAPGGPNMEVQADNVNLYLEGLPINGVSAIGGPFYIVVIIYMERLDS